jgi:uncharacterized protein (TIGR00369 family)
MLIEPKPENFCFGCGGGNPHGLRLTFEGDDAAKRIRGRFQVGADFQGGPGYLHGGIIATLLDEVMTKLSRFDGLHAVTAELNVEYLKPVPVDAQLLLESYEVRTEGRNHHRVGEIRDSSGMLLARGKGRFVNVDRKRP